MLHRKTPGLIVAIALILAGGASAENPSFPAEWWRAWGMERVEFLKEPRWRDEIAVALVLGPVDPYRWAMVKQPFVLDCRWYKDHEREVYVRWSEWPGKFWKLSAMQAARQGVGEKCENWITFSPERGAFEGPGGGNGKLRETAKNLDPLVDRINARFWSLTPDEKKKVKAVMDGKVIRMSPSVGKWCDRNGSRVLYQVLD